MDDDMVFEPIAIDEPNLEMLRFRRSQLDFASSLLLPSVEVQEVEDAS